MSCNYGVPGDDVLLIAGEGVEVTGTGKPGNPYRVSAAVADTLALEVRDSETVNLSMSGAGVPDDPYVVTAESSSNIDLRDLIGGVAANGRSPVWIGAADTGEFVFQPAGTWYCTSTTHPDATQRYQGLEIHETDTGLWKEFDGTAWVTKAGGSTSGGNISAALLTGIVPEVNLPDRLKAQPGIITDDLNTAIKTGWYRSNGALNEPVGTGWYWVEVIGHNASYAVQFATSFLPGSPTYRRALINGTWSAWHQLVLVEDAKTQLGSVFPVLDANGDISREAVPFKMAANHVTFSALTAQNGGWAQTVHVVFPVGRFKSTPDVTVGIHADMSVSQRAGALNVTKDSFDLIYWRADSHNGVVVSWIAMDEGAGS